MPMSVQYLNLYINVDTEVPGHTNITGFKKKTLANICCLPSLKFSNDAARHDATTKQAQRAACNPRVENFIFLNVTLRAAQN